MERLSKFPDLIFGKTLCNMHECSQIILTTLECFYKMHKTSRDISHRLATVIVAKHFFYKWVIQTGYLHKPHRPHDFFWKTLNSKLWSRFQTELSIVFLFSHNLHSCTVDFYHIGNMSTPASIFTCLILEEIELALWLVVFMHSSSSVFHLPHQEMMQASILLPNYCIALFFLYVLHISSNGEHKSVHACVSVRTLMPVN